MQKIEHIGIGDALLKAKNQLGKEMQTGRPGIEIGTNGEVTIRPSQYSAKEGFASHTFTTREMKKLLESKIFAMVCEADTDSPELPQICQRVPTADRRKQIRDAWADPNRVPKHKVETIQLAAFGIKTDAKKGLIFSPNSLVLVTDGGGRLSAAIDDFEQNEGKSLARAEPLWQLNFDLTGDIGRQIMMFLLHNRDAKKPSKGTVIGAENGILGLQEQKPDFVPPATFADKLAPTYVASHLYSDFQVNGSLTELFPWSFEGKSCKSRQFSGSSSSSSIVTAINSLRKTFNRVGITPKDLPKILDFGFRVWFKQCRTIVNSLQRQKIESLDKSIEKAKKYKSPYYLDTSLGVKVIALLTVRVFKVSGANEEQFIKLCEKVLHTHWTTRREDYLNPKTKKMSMERFFEDSKWFSGDGRFNSGEVNTQNCIKSLEGACDTVLGEITPPKNKHGKHAGGKHQRRRKAA